MYSASARELYIKLAPVMLILGLMPIINRKLRLDGIYHTLVMMQIERKMSSLLPNKTYPGRSEITLWHIPNQNP